MTVRLLLLLLILGARGEPSRDIEPLLDYDGVAEQLRCTPRFARKLVETRQLDSIKVGRLVRVERAAIARYIDAHRRMAKS
jgi:excisionase family DNA binding protein